MQGYAEVNRITELERINRLKLRTIHESLALFTELYKTWEMSGKKNKGPSLARRRDKDFIALRRLLDQLTRM